MTHLTLTQLLQRAAESPLSARTSAQITGVVEKLTKSGKPYLDLVLVDNNESVTLKLWEDTQAYQDLQQFSKGDFVAVEAHWTKNDFGLNAERPRLDSLDRDAVDALLAGDPEQAAFQEGEWEFMLGLIESLQDPRLKRLCQYFIERFGTHFRRTAAARNYHHARRGGLLEHVAQMMRSANQICHAYPELNRDLLLAGVLFHDCGKLWENSYAGDGFEMPYQLAGELLGHIPLGIELVNHLWREIEQEEQWPRIERPAASEVKLHLQHLVASHHGEHAFGSPTLPKTPEATALHYIDNLDAKLEMFRAGYRKAGKLADKIHERQRPLPANLVTPLEPYRAAGSDEV